eukprot:6207466-Pleurochrysis_carterae.AAC.7
MERVRRSPELDSAQVVRCRDHEAKAISENYAALPRTAILCSSYSPRAEFYPPRPTRCTLLRGSTSPIVVCRYDHTSFVRGTYQTSTLLLRRHSNFSAWFVAAQISSPPRYAADCTNEAARPTESASAAPSK